MENILDRIQSPQDLKQLNQTEIDRLCKEIREQIIATVTKNGGHMASNLGAVELTVALHKAFDAPEDRIIFDVGHQCYTHKLLTGRKDQFDSLRQKGGLSGFPNSEESEYDAYNTGHSSTSISAAVGMARARDLNGGDYSVIAVIGDGALTGGMSYEALNDGADLNSSLIVVLNDNEMSISKNVGGMTNYLNKIRSSPRYHSFKQRFKGFLKGIPFIGGALYRFVDWVKDCIKRMFMQPVFFEEIGYVYLGPIDGHDVERMVSVFSQAKELDRPVFIHVITKKGKGYRPAVQDPEKFHGVSPFVVEHNKEMQESCSHIFGRKLAELTEKDRRVAAITAAMPAGTGLQSYKKQYPKRFFDIGIAEEHGAAMAAGMAKSGLRPYFAVYSSFLQRAYDQILTDICIQKLPVTLCIDRCGIVGEDGETHQGVFDLPMLLPMPGMSIMQPASQYELEQMLDLTLSIDGPMAIRYPKGALWESPVQESVSYGRSQILFPICKTTVVSCGRMVGAAYEAIQRVSEQSGKEIGLVNLRFIKPLDEDMLEKLAKNAENVLVIEENCITGGIGDMIASRLSGIKEIHVYKMGIKEGFVKHGSVDELLHDLALDADGIESKLYGIMEDSQ